MFREKSSLFGHHVPKAESVGKKRPLEEEGDCEMECGETKRPCPPTNNSASRNKSLDEILNFPLPSTESVGCIVKMYTEEELPLNEIMEVVGVLSFDTPGIVADSEEREDFHPPSSVIPRLHCILSHRWLHNNPNLSTQAGQKWDQGLSYSLKLYPKL